MAQPWVAKEAVRMNFRPHLQRRFEPIPWRVADMGQQLMGGLWDSRSSSAAAEANALLWDKDLVSYSAKRGRQQGTEKEQLTHIVSSGSQSC